MTGKQKCKILKEIRRQIAAENDIRYVVEECTHKGKCRGTCPKCEWEVRMLERELEKRRAAGKKVALAGISAGFLLTSCSPIDTVKEIISEVSHPLQGDVMAETTSGVIEETDLHDAENQENEIPGEPALPNETETCETEPPVIEGILPVPDETEEPLPEIEGEVLPSYEEEEVVLEGDIRFIEPESGGTP